MSETAPVTEPVAAEPFQGITVNDLIHCAVIETQVSGRSIRRKVVVDPYMTPLSRGDLVFDAGTGIRIDGSPPKIVSVGIVLTARKQSCDVLLLETLHDKNTYSGRRNVADYKYSWILRDSDRYVLSSEQKEGYEKTLEEIKAASRKRKGQKEPAPKKKQTVLSFTKT